MSANLVSGGEDPGQARIPTERGPAAGMKNIRHRRLGLPPPSKEEANG